MDAVITYKAYLNLHDGWQELGANYFEMFPPVMTWMAICFLLVVAILNHWSMRQIDIVMTYTQAPIKCEIYMTLSHGILTWYGHAKDYVLKLINNICGQKQASNVFADYSDVKLQEINFQCLVSDQCVFVREKVIFVAHVNDGIFLSPHHT